MLRMIHKVRLRMRLRKLLITVIAVVLEFFLIDVKVNAEESEWPLA